RRGAPPARRSRAIVGGRRLRRAAVGDACPRGCRRAVPGGDDSGEARPVSAVESPITIVEADLADPAHARDVVAMTAAYAEDALGNGGTLPADVLARLVPALREHPTTVVLLAYEAGRAVGIATCFLGFTTFAARPLLNIHDLSVVPDLRGRG